MRFSWKMVFDDFKKHYPDKCRKGTSYSGLEHMAIVVYIPEDGKYKYEYFGSKLTLIEKYLSRRQLKVLHAFEREEAMRDVFKNMRTKGISQSELSRLSGISRQSINRYKSGTRTPTYATIGKLKSIVEKYVDCNGY